MIRHFRKTKSIYCTILAVFLFIAFQNKRHVFAKGDEYKLYLNDIKMIVDNMARNTFCLKKINKILNRKIDAIKDFNEKTSEIITEDYTIMLCYKDAIEKKKGLQPIMLDFLGKKGITSSELETFFGPMKNRFDSKQSFLSYVYPEKKSQEYVFQISISAKIHFDKKIYHIRIKSPRWGEFELD